MRVAAHAVIHFYFVIKNILARLKHFVKNIQVHHRLPGLMLNQCALVHDQLPLHLRLQGLGGHTNRSTNSN